MTATAEISLVAITRRPRPAASESGRAFGFASAIRSINGRIAQAGAAMGLCFGYADRRRTFVGLLGAEYPYQPAERADNEVHRAEQ